MKYLGVDFGLKRVGFAYSEGVIASPMKAIPVFSSKDAVQKILNQGKDFDKIIIGKPGGLIGKKVEKIVQILKQVNIDVETQDENLSSKRAIVNMIDLGISQKKRRINDAFAAAIILQEYLDNL